MQACKAGQGREEATSVAIFQPHGVKIDGMPSRHEAVAP